MKCEKAAAVLIANQIKKKLLVFATRSTVSVSTMGYSINLSVYE